MKAIQGIIPPSKQQHHIPEVSNSQQHTTSYLTPFSVVRTMTVWRLQWAKHVAQMERNYKELYWGKYFLNTENGQTSA